MGASVALSPGAVSRDAKIDARTAIALGICRSTAATPEEVLRLQLLHCTCTRSPHSRTAPTATCMRQTLPV